MNWIDINERLPAKDQVVLIYSPVDGLGLGQLSNAIGSSKSWYWLYKSINESKRVEFPTHWAAVNPPNNANAADLPHLAPLMEGASSAAPKPVTSSAKLQSAD